MMVISYNSQLGLRFNEPSVQLEFLELMKEYLEKELGLTKSFLDKVTNAPVVDGNLSLSLSDEENDFFQPEYDKLMGGQSMREVRAKVTDLVGDKVLIDEKESSYYFICDSVYKCAELIRIKEWFSGRTLKDIKFGKYTYLMGKNKMVRFVVVYNAIKGFYYDSKDRIVFEWGIEMEEGEYFFSHNRSAEFTTIMRLLTFVELGDIEVKMLEAGRNNGKEKKDGKVTNTSEKTVYVVDSSWNQIIIRTTGFAVRGHFRLQACGEGLRDRKLIWVDAFEKHGYRRRPTGEIVR